MLDTGMDRARSIATLSGGLFLAACTVVLSACGDDASNRADNTEVLANAERGFVGTVEGTNAFVAVVVGGGEAIVYICDGDDDLAEWFAGAMDETNIRLTTDTGALVEAAPSDVGYSGTVTFANGETHRFDAEPAAPEAGLFRVTGPEAQDAGITAGWIVTNDGAQQGSLRVRGAARTAPRAPAAGSVTVDGKRLAVSIIVVLEKTPSAPAPVPIPYPNTGTVAPTAD